MKQYTKLITALKCAAKVAPKKPMLPVLANVLFEPTQDGLTITATDLESYYRVKIAGVYSNDTTPFLANPHQVLEALNGREAPLVYTLASQQLIVGSATIPALDAKDFPVFPAKFKHGHLNADNYAEVKLDKLDWLMKALSSEVTRLDVRCLHISAKHGELVATNGCSMHVVKVDGLDGAWDINIPKDGAVLLQKLKASSLLIPKKAKCEKCGGTGYKRFADLTAKEMSMVIEQAGKQLNEESYNKMEDGTRPDCPSRKLHLKPDHVVWIGSNGDESLYMRAETGASFPDYKSTMELPTPPVLVYTADKAMLLAALKQCCAFSEKSTHHAVKLSFKDGDHRASAHGAKGDITVPIGSGPVGAVGNFEITVDAKKLINLIGNCGERVEIRFQGNNKALIVKGDNSVAAQMPLKM